MAVGFGTKQENSVVKIFPMDGTIFYFYKVNKKRVYRGGMGEYNAGIFRSSKTVLKVNPGKPVWALFNKPNTGGCS